MYAACLAFMMVSHNYCTMALIGRLMFGVFLKCKFMKDIYCAKKLTFFIPAVNSYTKWEDFKDIMENTAWPESPVDPVLAGFFKPRSRRPIIIL